MVTYIGLSMNIGQLFGDIYFNSLLSGLMELPVYILLGFFLGRCGRKPTLLASYSTVLLGCLLGIPFLYTEGRCTAHPGCDVGPTRYSRAASCRACCSCVRLTAASFINVGIILMSQSYAIVEGNIPRYMIYEVYCIYSHEQLLKFLFV